jgi:putative ABC transport system permease protein
MINRWLEQFAYRTQMHPMIFVVSIVGSLLLAWTTVLYYSANLAMMNPVDSLKEE